MDAFLSFFSFSDPNVRYVVFGAMLLAASSAVVGCFTLLRHRSLSGDAVSHSVLPGVCLAFIITGNKNPVVLLIGAFASGWLSLYLLDYISRKSRIKEDTAIGIILSVFFGLGIMLLTSIQQSGDAAQSGLDKFLFGKAASLIGSDLLVFASIGVLLVFSVWLFFKEFTLLSFDPNFARVIGLPVRGLELLLTTLTVLAVVEGIQAVGVVLMAAMLITPAAAARYWTQNITKMVWLAAGFGAASGLAGAFISYVAPSMPTGPWIVMALSCMAAVSFLFAPRKGIVQMLRLRQQNSSRIQEENLLKTLYHLGETELDFFRAHTPLQINNKRPFRTRQFHNILHRLEKQRLVAEKPGGAWVLTQKGKERGQRIAKIHRLWELFLTTHLSIAPDHVHDDAETMEHIITPEIEKKLEELMSYPPTDPHGERIPY